MSIRAKQCLFTVGGLTIIDMLIKFIIDSCFMESEFIIGNLIGFKPYLNITQLSIFNNELSLGVSTGTLIVLNILLIPVIPLSFRWANKGNELGDSINICEDLLLAGTVCSLLDKIIWGGSLDYIYLLDRWIIDLKDIYLFSAVGSFLCLSSGTISVSIERKTTSHSKLRNNGLWKHIFLNGGGQVYDFLYSRFAFGT